MVGVKKAITSALVRLLRPLVRILLKNDIPYGTFSEVAKWVYVDIASKEFQIPGRKQTVSRISTISGLTRKEVKRLQEIAEQDDLGASERYNRAARVIGGWLRDPRFLDRYGNPAELFVDGEEPSFPSLVKAYSGDVPARAIRDELVRAGVVEVERARVRLLTRGYIVRKGDVEKLDIMGEDVSELITTIGHNIASDPAESFLQRKVSYDNIPEEALPELRRLAKEKGQAFLESLDRIISQHDKDVNPSVQGRGRKKTGVGIFYFE